MNNGISIIICAFNEEKNIRLALESIRKALRGIIDNYEILVVDDGSTDNTFKIIKDEAKKNPKIKVIHRKDNRGFGCSFRQGINSASKYYLTGFPGDNDMSWKALRELVKQREKADLITSYMVNPESRNNLRRVISRLFVLLMNLLFGLHLKYYNGYFICKTELLKKIPLRSEGYVFMAEIKVRVLKKKASFREIPFEHTGRKKGHSKILTFKNLRRTIYDLVKIAEDIYL